MNGHVPVREKNGESPIKGNGLLLVIDGGFCRAYHDKTGIAGYTLVYSSHGLSLRTHQPFQSAEVAIRENQDILSRVNIVSRTARRVLVADVDDGAVMREKVEDLKKLLYCYRNGILKEQRVESAVW